MTTTVTAAPAPVKAKHPLTGQDPFIRTKKGCYYATDNVFGAYYRKVDDPKGTTDPDFLKSFWLKENVEKLPFELLQAIISFFRMYVRGTYVSKNPTVLPADTTSEVQVCLLRKEDDLSEWKVVVPKQVVGAVTVDARTANTCDILSGEEYTVFPPVGYLYCGSVHSHNDMKAFWSGRDDEGELGVPGMHCTIGEVTKDTFEICASLVQNRLRYVFDPMSLLDINEDNSIPNSKATKSRTVWAESIDISPVVHNYVSQFSYNYRQGYFPGNQKFLAGPAAKSKKGHSKESNWHLRDTQWATADIMDDDYIGLYRDYGQDLCSFEEFYGIDVYGGNHLDDLYNTLGKVKAKPTIEEVSEEYKAKLKRQITLIKDRVQEVTKSELGFLLFIELLSEELGVALDPTITDVIDYHYYSI